MGYTKCSLYDKMGEKHNLIISSPKLEDLYKAQEIYLETICDCRDADLFSEQQLLTYLLDNGYWSQAEEDRLKQLPKEIEDLKVEIYNAFLRTSSRNNLKKILGQRIKEQDTLFGKRHKYDYLSCVGLANFIKSYYLTARSIQSVDKELNLDYDSPSFLLDAVIDFKSNNRITETEYRTIARSDLWKSLWNSNVLTNKELTEEQRNLYLFSKMYDNISENPECPHESIIQDDDMLDGWIILQRRKREGEQDKKIGEDSITNEKIRNADYVFIPVETEEDLKRVDNMNSPYAKAVLQSRFNKLSKEGEVKDEDFSDQKQKVMLALNKKG